MLLTRLRKWWNVYQYESVVFITGAAILVVEVAATRVLSPYYGNTIYTVSSVVGVILGALSVGYWKGGAEADENQQEKIFYTIITRSGYSLILLYLLVVFILPLGGNLFSLESGPLVWSLILFFPPSYLMGKLSPFAIILAKKSQQAKGLGHITGGIFFASTAGSIVGSLATGFILIPHFGIRAILFATTAVILTLGMAGCAIYSKRKERKDLVIAFVFILLALAAVHLFTSRLENWGRLYVHDGVYEKLTVTDGVYAGKPARFFIQDRSGSGGMFLESDTLAFEYTKYYKLFRFATTAPEHALFIGGGIYSMPKALHKDVPETAIDVVDIEPRLETIAKTYFELPDTPKILTHIGDGRRFLSSTNTTYDLIFSDVYYSLYSIPAHFTTKEFFALARKKLTPNGVFLANIIGSTELTKDSLLLSEINTMHEVFPNMSIIAVDSATSSSIQNFILLGMNGTSTLDELCHDEQHCVDPQLAKILSSHVIALRALPYQEHPMLTDDYSPVEHLVAALIGNTSTEKEPALTLPQTEFSGTHALDDIRRIVGIGSRAIGTKGHEMLGEQITDELTHLGLAVHTQSWQEKKDDGSMVTLTNIIARIDPDKPYRILVGTHYDSIARAYRDTKHPEAYMPGADNSASGVATLLELSRALASSSLPSSIGVDMVFFDGEEGLEALGEGDQHWKALGSTYFASHLQEFYPHMLPRTGIVLDMVCNKKLTLLPERTSVDAARSRVESFWELGKQIAPDTFKSEPTTPIGDDQTALNQNGIPSFLVIDFDHTPWFNTTEDTPDKCSAQSLETVGVAVESYLRTR